MFLRRRASSRFGRAHPAHRRTGWWWQTDRRLVAILLDIPKLHQHATRHELLVLMGEHQGRQRPFPAPDDPDAGAHLRAIVRAARQAGTLDVLRDALLVVAPDDTVAAWFNVVATALTRTNGPLPAGYMVDLVAELRNHPREFGRTAVSQYATERRAAGRPVDGCTVPELLFRLYDARVPAVGLGVPRADLRRFLCLLAAEPDRSKRLAALIGSVLDGDEADPVTAGAPVNAERQVVIQIRVEEEDAPSDLPYTRRRYSLRGFHYEGNGEGLPDFHCSHASPDLFTGDELERRGLDFLSGWRIREEADWGPNKRVEFLLPDSLLGYPAELWPGGSSGIPLSRSCQVVVRSLRRYKDSSLHREWRRRWEALDRDCLPGEALERIGWMRPEECEGANSPTTGWSCPDSKYPPLRLTDPADVEDWLRLNADLACLGLGAPYDHHDPLVRDAVLDALLEDGIPVMVWRRDAGDPGRLLDALRDGRPPALLAELPHSVLEARKRGRRDPLSVGKQITLLWDDATCVFSEQDGQMSGTRGAGEGAT